MVVVEQGGAWTKNAVDNKAFDQKGCWLGNASINDVCTQAWCWSNRLFIV